MFHFSVFLCRPILQRVIIVNWDQLLEKQWMCELSQ